MIYYKVTIQCCYVLIVCVFKDNQNEQKFRKSLTILFQYYSKLCSVTDIFSTDKMKKQLVTFNRTSCLGSSWILMSCQWHRVISEQFNTIITIICKFTFQNYSHTERAMSAPGGKIREETEEVNQTISQVNPQNQSLRKHKTKHTINIRQIFRVSPINPC